MKNLTTIVLIVVLLASCSLEDNSSDIELFENEFTVQEITNLPQNNLSVFVYEGCEYIIYKVDKDANSSYGFMAHKGNCSNPIHQCE